MPVSSAPAPTASWRPSLPGMSTVLKVCAMGFLLLSPTGASATDWRTAAEAKDHYSGRKCTNGDAGACIREGKSLTDCRDLVPDGADFDLSSFTWFSGGAVANVHLHSDRACIVTAPSPGAVGIQTCFADIERPETHTVEPLGGPLTQEHLGLKQGERVNHLGVRKNGKECGTFKTVQAKEPVQPVVMHTTLGDGIVAQLAFDPQNPSDLWVTYPDGVTLGEKNGKPASAVFQGAVAKALQQQPADACVCAKT